LNKKIKDLIMVVVIAAIIAVIDLLDGSLQWRMDAGVLFLILLIVFWMRSLIRTRGARKEIYRKLESDDKREMK
jgi:Ca2+/Na+ antiporter